MLLNFTQVLQLQCTDIMSYNFFHLCFGAGIRRREALGPWVGVRPLSGVGGHTDAIVPIITSFLGLNLVSFCDDVDLIHQKYNLIYGDEHNSAYELILIQ